MKTTQHPFQSPSSGGLQMFFVIYSPGLILRNRPGLRSHHPPPEGSTATATTSAKTLGYCRSPSAVVVHLIIGRSLLAVDPSPLPSPFSEPLSLCVVLIRSKTPGMLRAVLPVGRTSFRRLVGLCRRSPSREAGRGRCRASVRAEGRCGAGGPA